MTIKLKKAFLLIASACFMILLLTTTAFASSRKLITKTVNGTLNIYRAYTYNYHFNSSTVLTYTGNSISQISDLSFSNIGYTASQPSLSANFIPSQKSKANYGSYATYVVTLTRNIYGYYSDKIDYTLTYRPSDSGTPYSLNDEDSFIVTVEVSEPYDIEYLN